MEPETLGLAAVGLLFGSGGAAWVGTRIALNGLSKRMDNADRRSGRVEDKLDGVLERVTRVETRIEYLIEK